MPSYLLPWVAFDLRELELGVIGVHLTDLLPSWRPEHLDDFDQLVDTWVTWKDGLPQQQLSQHAARTPHVNLRSVVNGAKDELGSPGKMMIFIEYKLSLGAIRNLKVYECLEVFNWRLFGKIRYINTKKNFV